MPIRSRRDAPARSAGPAAVYALVACALAGCGPNRRPAAAEASSPTGAGYTAPPQLLAAIRTTRGTSLHGSAPAGATITLKSPDGASVTAVADRLGGWTLGLPAAGAPRLYAFWMVAAGRMVRGEGALATVPAPAAPALLLRAGAAALPAVMRATRPVLAAVDYDAEGGVAVAGLAPPEARLRLAVDGRPADAGRPDALGRFQLMGPKSQPLAPGLHRLTVTSDADRAEAEVTLSPSAPLDGAPVRTAREADGWRIDWTLPGGGRQTTVVLDTPPPPAGRAR